MILNLGSYGSISGRTIDILNNVLGFQLLLTLFGLHYKNMMIVSDDHHE
jgi:hypothetical protein